jgi:hypothetical protein
MSQLIWDTQVTGRKALVDLTLKLNRIPGKQDSNLIFAGSVLVSGRERRPI